jgi:hypothetical protein
MKLENFIIAFAVVGLFAGVIGLFLASTPVQGGVYAYNATLLSGYDKMTQLQDNMARMNETLTDVKQGDNPDVGSWIGSGFTVIKTTFTSFGMFSDITNQAIEQTGMGAAGQNFRGTLLIIVLTLFFFAVIALLVGREA